MSGSTHRAAPPATEIPRLLALDGRGGLAAHADRWGQMPAGGPEVIAEVERSGLRGRGGAGFPTAVKMRAVSAGRQAVVVGNGAEREPLSGKDKVLLAQAPHLVLDGLSIAAECVGATEAVLCVDRAATRSLRAVADALKERARSGADVVPIRVEATPGAFVTGEESALVHWLNGGPAKPTFVPPRPFERGVRGRPTLINNVETLAPVALIARFGSEWFRTVGTPHHPGTTLVTVSGDVGRQGVYEVPMGRPLEAIVDAAGPTEPPQALLVGGYSGMWVPYPAAGRLGFDSESLARLNASVGCGAITVLGASRCGPAETAAVARWMAGQSAGQCGPCVHGLPALADALDATLGGGRQESALRRLRQVGETIVGRGACHHPDGVVRMVRSAVTVFAADLEAHRSRGPCRVRPGALPTPGGEPEWR